MSPELLSYIDSELTKGVTTNQLKDVLIGGGWNEIVVSQALAQVSLDRMRRTHFQEQPLVTNVQSKPLSARRVGLGFSVLLAALIGGIIYWRVNSSTLASVNTTVPSDWKTFSSTYAHAAYKLRYPSNWKVSDFLQSEKDRSQFIQFESPESSTYIEIKDFPDDSNISKSWQGAEVLASVKEMNTRIIDHRMFLVHGLHAEQHEFETFNILDEKKRLYIAETNILNGTDRYAIAFSIDPSDPGANTYKKIYATMVSSLESVH